jgi:hypothetical protein
MNGKLGLAMLVSVTCMLAKGQTIGKWKNYRVSRVIDTSHLSAKKLFRDSNQVAAFENNIAQFYLYRNGRQVLPPKGKIKTAFFPAACLGFKFEDTLMMNCGLGRLEGLGVGMKIFQNQFDGILHVNSKNENVYKLHKRDSVYINDLNAGAVSQSMKLLQAPTFSSGEIIIGEYNAVYHTIYKRTKDGKDFALQYKVRVLFKCKVTGMDALKDQLRQNGR